jgi:hypothetical protein
MALEVDNISLLIWSLYGMTYEIVGCEIESQYRYSLTVKTESKSNNKLVVIQCNPSEAKENRSDPTVGKVSIWANENSYGEVVFLNLFAYISPYISELEGKEYSILVGPKNDVVLKDNISNNSTIVLAWGGDIPVTNEQYIRRVKEIMNIMQQTNSVPHRVGALSYGTHPRHGRMWNKGNRELSELNWESILL